MKKIAIFGVPRSGTSWLGQILNSHPDVLFRYQPLFSHQHKGRLTTQSSASEIDAFYEEIRWTTDEFASMTSDFHRNYPQFVKNTPPKSIAFKETRYLQVVSNLLARSESIFVLCIIRHPVEVLNSWMNARKEFAVDWDIQAEWLDAPSKNRSREEEFYGYRKWKTVYFDFLELERQYPERCKIVRYSELKEHTLQQAEGIMNFCSLKMSEQVESFIQESSLRHDDDPYSVFRARAGQMSWEKQLPEWIICEIEADIVRSQIWKF